MISVPLLLPFMDKNNIPGSYVFFLLSVFTQSLVEVNFAIGCSKSEITCTSFLLSHTAILIDTHIVKS